MTVLKSSEPGCSGVEAREGRPRDAADGDEDDDVCDRLHAEGESEQHPRVLTQRRERTAEDRPERSADAAG